jgi:hypothetical protein
VQSDTRWHGRIGCNGARRLCGSAGCIVVCMLCPNFCRHYADTKNGSIDDESYPPGQMKSQFWASRGHWVMTPQSNRSHKARPCRRGEVNRERNALGMLWACSEQVYLSAAVIAFRTGIPLASRQLHPVGNPVGEDDLPRDSTPIVLLTSTQSVQTRQVPGVEASCRAAEAGRKN